MEVGPDPDYAYMYCGEYKLKPVINVINLSENEATPLWTYRKAHCMVQ